MKPLSILVMMLTIGVALLGCAPNAKDRELERFITDHVEKIKPMHKEASLASWDAALSGKSADYDRVSRLTLKIRRVYSDPRGFAFLKDMKESGQISSAISARQLSALYNAYLGNQIEPGLLKKIVDLGTEIEKNFSTFRGTIEGRKVTDNEIKDILKTQTDSGRRRQAWLIAIVRGEGF